MDTQIIHNLLYATSFEDAKLYLSSCSDRTTLHIYALNYNWNNGFDLPQTIINNPACTLGTALMMFYMADGYRYLSERNESSDIPDWLSFIKDLYRRIYAGVYTDCSIAFSVPLSKVQIFKLKKLLKENEQIFVTPIDGENCEFTV